MRINVVFKKVLSLRNLSILLLIGAIYYPIQGITKTPPVAKNRTKVVKIDFILIEKQKRQMTVFKDSKPLKHYSIALGFNPVGHKQEKGDGKTPEGIYKISDKNPGSQFYKSLRISYPNATDTRNAVKQGKKTGGDIMIHGLPKAFNFVGKAHILKDWTLGCVAVTNAEIDEIYAATAVGTQVKIVP
jgi:Uncharacterized protein conserved in bacteria